MRPVRQDGELLSSYRFRYARFCVIVSGILGLFLYLLAHLSSALGILAVLLFILASGGIITAVGASVIFLIGGAVAQREERSKSFKSKLQKIKAIALCITSGVTAAIFIYWSIYGVIAGKTLRVSRIKSLFVYRVDSPDVFWFSTSFLFIAGVFMLIATWKMYTAAFTPNLSLNPDLQQENAASQHGL